MSRYDEILELAAFHAAQSYGAFSDIPMPDLRRLVSIAASRVDKHNRPDSRWAECGAEQRFHRLLRDHMNGAQYPADVWRGAAERWAEALFKRYRRDVQDAFERVLAEADAQQQAHGYVDYDELEGEQDYDNVVDLDARR